MSEPIDERSENMAGGSPPRGIDELAALPAPSPPPIGGALERELAAIRPIATRRPVRQLAVLVGVSLIYGGGLVVVLSTRGDFHELPIAWLVGVAIAWLLGFAVPSYFALIPRSGSVTPRWQIAAIAAVIVAIGFVAFGLAIQRAGPSSVVYGIARFGRGHSCLEIGLATALVPVVIGAVALRGALPIGSRWIAAALGAGGGCLGGLVLHVHCNVVDPLHLGLIHGGVVIVAALVSAAIVPRTTA